jgi:hypothetical protein
MRRAILGLTALAAAAVVVFLATYLVGRHQSLEVELGRLTAPRPAPSQGKSQGIPSLHPVETPPEAPAAPQAPGGEPLGEGILVSRSPLEPSGLVIVADFPGLAPAPGDESRSFAGGLAAFFSRPPEGLQIGLRALAGVAGECGPTDTVLGFGQRAGGEFAAALDPGSALGRGPRNPAGAVSTAANDLAPVTGERAVVVITGGEAGCPGDLCGGEPPPGGPRQRIHVVLLAPRLQSGTDGGLPGAGDAGMPQPVFEPPWAVPYRCLADRSGGTLVAVSSPQELEQALRRVADTLEASVVVKAFHYTGQEIKGVSPGGDAGWGATVRPSAGATAEVRALEAGQLPASFAVSRGVYVVKTRFAGQERTAAVAVAAGERAEVRVSFATGELFMQGLDATGGEIIGDSAGFRCAWGVDVFPAGSEEAPPLASTCSFPARLELAPGTYRVRARWKGVERVIEEITVEAGASIVRDVSFAKHND